MTEPIQLPLHKKIVQAWRTLPRKVKKIYKISMVVLVLAGYLVYSNIAKDSESSLQSKVSLPSAQDSNETGRAGESEMDYALKAGLKKSEEDLQLRAAKNNETYLPNTDNLDIDLTQEFVATNVIYPEEPEIEKEGKIDHKEPPRSRLDDTEFSTGRTASRNVQVDTSQRDRTFEDKVNAKLAIYQALQQSAMLVDTGGAMSVRIYPEPVANVTNVAGNGISNNQVENKIQNVSQNTLTAGDVVIVQLDNYLNSDDNGKFVRLTMLSPIEGPVIMGEYVRQGEFLNVSTSTISYNGVTKNFKGLLVKADGSMSSGISTDTNNHTLYRWGALVLSGALSGIGEVYLSGSDKVIRENGDIIQTNERGAKDIAIGIGKGIGDRTASIAEKEFDIPPTVIADPKEQAIYGVMLVQDAALDGFPLIDRNDVY